MCVTEIPGWDALRPIPRVPWGRGCGPLWEKTYGSLQGLRHQSPTVTPARAVLRIHFGIRGPRARQEPGCRVTHCKRAGDKNSQPLGLERAEPLPTRSPSPACRSRRAPWSSEAGPPGRQQGALDSGPRGGLGRSPGSGDGVCSLRQAWRQVEPAFSYSLSALCACKLEPPRQATPPHLLFYRWKDFPGLDAAVPELDPRPCAPTTTPDARCRTLSSSSNVACLVPPSPRTAEGRLREH